MLLDAGITANTNCGSRAIGYRQALDALAAWHADPGALSEGAVLGLVQAIQAASRQLCHRQMTWFRDEAMFRCGGGLVGKHGCCCKVSAVGGGPAGTTVGLRCRAANALVLACTLITLQVD